MNMPGFTAEVSLSQTNQLYRGGGTVIQSNRAIYAAAGDFPTSYHCLAYYGLIRARRYCPKGPAGEKCRKDFWEEGLEICGFGDQAGSGGGGAGSGGKDRASGRSPLLIVDGMEINYF
jgi:hypothetical protein